jgi:RHS repeat-associated protein
VEYVDAPIIRYRDGNTDGDVLDEGDSSLYYLHDANFNVTGLVDRAETAVVERYMYEPYGRVTVLNGAADADEGVSDWTADADNTSDWSNEIFYCGYRRDAESALYHVRHRYYHPTLGRWVSRDPVVYVDGPSFYQYLGCNPAASTDPSGLCLGDIWKWICDWLRGKGKEPASRLPDPLDWVKAFAKDAPQVLNKMHNENHPCGIWFRHANKAIQAADCGDGSGCQAIATMNAKDLCYNYINDDVRNAPMGLAFLRAAQDLSDGCKDLAASRAK